MDCTKLPDMVGQSHGPSKEEKKTRDLNRMRPRHDPDAWKTKRTKVSGQIENRLRKYFQEVDCYKRNDFVDKPDKSIGLMYLRVVDPCFQGITSNPLRELKFVGPRLMAMPSEIFDPWRFMVFCFTPEERWDRIMEDDIVFEDIGVRRSVA